MKPLRGGTNDRLAASPLAVFHSEWRGECLGKARGSERAMGDGDCSVSSECKRALFFSPPLVHRPPDGRTEEK